MVLFKFKKQKPDTLPALSPESKVNNTDEVLTTIEGLSLPLDEIILVGSAALTLLNLERRAHDIDLVAHPDVLDAILASGQLPSGVSATQTVASRLNGRLHFQADTSPLPTELFTNRSMGDDPDKEAEMFERMRVSSRTVNGVHVISPDKLYNAKLNVFRVGDERFIKRAQDRYDMRLLATLMHDERTLNH